MTTSPMYRISSRGKGKYRTSNASPKRTIKYLAEVGDPRIQRIVLNSSKDSVYKSICNAFFNLAQNSDIKLSTRQKRLLKPFQVRIKKLISPSVGIRQKKAVIQSGGGIFLGTILPLVLSTALSLLGTSFISRK